MTPFLGEIIGTALLILLGDGVVANVVLKGTKGSNSGWIVVTFGWAMAVFVGVFVSASASGAHLNPAVTVALATAGKFDWGQVPIYVLAQMLGACIGAFLVWVHYKSHFDATENQDSKLAVFCTTPAIRATGLNLVSEIIGTAVLAYAVLHITSPDGGLGGTTGYAINPARDLGPRLMHALLPLPNKRDSDWTYAWIPVTGPIIGGILGALIFRGAF
jgi:glycerol uptake facilitator protein